MDERSEMRKAWLVLSVVALASVLVGLNSSALNVALPTVVRRFHADAGSATWILLSYMIANASLLLVFGRLSDRFGRRGMYLVGLAIYTGASLACGLAPDEWWLIGFRVVQAVGAAMLLTNSAALVAAAFPRHRLGEGMGIYLASFSVAQLIGPTLGGILAQVAGWEWVFWFNVPIGVVCFVWAWFALARTETVGRAVRGWDPAGNALVLVILCVGLAALSQANTLGWEDPLIVGGFVLALALVPLLIWHERRTLAPVIEFDLLRSPGFGLGLLAALLTNLSQFGLALLISLHAQAVLGKTPVEAGFAVLPLALASVVASTFSGRLQRRISATNLASIGGILRIIAFVGLIAIAPFGDQAAWLIVALVVSGIGAGLFISSNATALLSGVPDDRLGAANALRMLVQSLGLVIGTAGALVILTSGLPPQLRGHALAGTITGISADGTRLFVSGYQHTLIAMLIVALLSLWATIAVGRRRT